MRHFILATCCAALMGAAAASMADEPAKAPAKAESTKTDTAKAEKTCTPTGTHIPVKGKDCVVRPPGRSYTRDQLDQTGETNLAAALKKLDPALY